MYEARQKPPLIATPEIDTEALHAVLESIPGVFEAREIPLGEDFIMGAIQKFLGYDGVPQVVDHLAGHGVDLWRGVAGESPGRYAEEFRSGPLYYGEGMYGNGTYMVAGEDALREADDYAYRGPTGLIHAELSSEARIGDYEALAGEHVVMLERATDSQVHRVVEDLGRWALLRGFDAIRIRGDDFEFVNILNRTMLSVQSAAGTIDLYRKLGPGEAT
jgi:hypothetical protein